MVKVFIADPPGKQTPETVRQFRALQDYITQLEARLVPETHSGNLIIGALDPVAWTPATLDPVPVLGPGRFLINPSLDITGVAGPGWIQFRVNGSEGRVWDADDNVDRQIGNAFFLDGPGPVTVEVRGEAVTAFGGVFTVSRQGVQP